MKNEKTSGIFSNLSPACVGRLLLKNLWMLVAGALIFYMGATVVLQQFFKPQYQASMTYAVTSRETSYVTNRNLSATKEVAAVMTSLLGSDVILQNLQEAEPALKGFSGTITATQVGESNLLTVAVRSPVPKDAFLALNTLVEIFPELSEYISSKCVVQVIQNPMVSTSPVNATNVKKTATYAAAAGAVLVAALLIWIHVSRETVQTTRGARNLLDAYVLAVVGHERKNRTLRSMIKRTKKGLQVFDPSTSYAYTEQINNICARIEQEMQGGGKTFLITGVGENEGKSTVAGNVAAMMAMKGKNTALLGCDLRKPALFKFFDGAYNSQLPLNEMLAQPYTRANFLKCAVCHPKLGLYMLFASKASEKPMELIQSHTMRLTMQQLQVFDCVIVDSPPMGFFADTAALADMVDASILVVRQDCTPACDLNDAVDTLKNSKSQFLGCVLNDMRGHSLHRYGYGYGYGHKQKRSSSQKSQS